METESEVTPSQLDSTISSASVINKPIILNPHPLVLGNQEKMKILRKWERKFKDGTGNESRSGAVKLETKFKELSQNVTHFVVDDFGSWDKSVNYHGCYSTPLFEAMLMGAWILDFKWITNCLEEEEIVNEEHYAVSNFSTIYSMGVLLKYTLNIVIGLQ